MENFRRIIEHNRDWAARMKASDPEYFTRRAERQTPQILYIGCADSRVPAETATGAAPGEIFVHRNIANVVLPSDLSAMSVLQYAVEVLDVKHVIVVGHYGCAPVRAAMGERMGGLVDHWLGPIRNVVRWNRHELDGIADDEARFDRVVELNVLEQLYHLSETPIIQEAWAKGRRPLLHGLVYDIRDGLLREIATEIDSPEAAERLAERRLSGVAAGPPPFHPEGQAHANEALADTIAARVAERLASMGTGTGTATGRSAAKR